MSTGSKRWQVWHQNLSADGSVETENLILGSAVESSYTSQIRNPTANHIEVRDVDSAGNGYVNKSGDNYIAYVFAQVDGFSAFGRFTGGNVDDTKIYLDFKPNIIGFKRISGGAAHWYTFDRNVTSTSDSFSTPRNVDTHWQPIDLNQAHADPGTSEICANGFRALMARPEVHENNHVYIYWAVGGHMPLKYATGGA